MAERPLAPGYEAWMEKIKAKYPDAYGRTTGQHGWSRLGGDGNGPTLTPHMSGPFYTDVSAESYSRQWLVGTYNHNTDTGKIFAPM